MGMNDRQKDSNKKRSREKKGGVPPWQGFVDVVLSSEHKEQLAGYVLEVEFGLEQLDELLATGYKVSFGLDVDGHTRRCTLANVDHDSDMAGYGLSGRGRSVQNAFASAVFKHLYVLDEDWSTAKVLAESVEFD